MVLVYTSTALVQGGDPLASNDDHNGAAVTAACGPLLSQVTLTLSAGTAYVIVVDGYAATDLGSIVLRVLVRHALNYATHLGHLVRQLALIGIDLILV